MQIKEQTNLLDSLDKHAINSLGLTLSDVLEGRDDIVMAPVYKDIPDSIILEKITKILDKVHLTDTLRKIEETNRSKFGPRSIAIPWEERKASLFSYFSHKDYDPGRFEEVSSGHMMPWSYSSVSDRLIKSSNSGLPYMKRKGLVLKDAIANVDKQAGIYPCVLFTRTQEGKKTRNIWGFPISDTIQEQSIYLPFQTFEKSLPYRSALHGADAVDRAITYLIQNRTPSELVYCVDFSSYDATVSPELAYKAFSYIASQFQSEFHEYIYGLFRRFVTIPILTPDGEVVGPHGVPSGSSFTNTIDSLVQYQIAGREHCEVQGDDGVYLVHKSERDSFPRVFDEAGLKLNESKSFIFDDYECVYLQRYYSPAYPSRTDRCFGGVYSAFRAFNRIKYLESWTDFERMGIEPSDFFSLRTIMILENCKHHPAFEELVKYAYSLDKTGLSFSKQGLTAYSRAMDSKARAGLFNTKSFQKGIHGFETMKVIKEL